jgi:hypothetical protein
MGLQRYVLTPYLSSGRDCELALDQCETKR